MAKYVENKKFLFVKNQYRIKICLTNNSYPSLKNKKFP